MPNRNVTSTTTVTREAKAGFVTSFVDGIEWKNDIQFTDCVKAPGRVVFTRAELNFCFQGSIYSPDPANPQKFSFHEEKQKTMLDQEFTSLALGNQILVKLRRY